MFGTTKYLQTQQIDIINGPQKIRFQSYGDHLHVSFTQSELEQLFLGRRTINHLYIKHDCMYFVIWFQFLFALHLCATL